MTTNGHFRANHICGPDDPVPGKVAVLGRDYDGFRGNHFRVYRASNSSGPSQAVSRLLLSQNATRYCGPKKSTMSASTRPGRWISRMMTREPRSNLNVSTRPESFESSGFII